MGFFFNNGLDSVRLVLQEYARIKVIHAKLAAGIALAIIDSDVINDIKNKKLTSASIENDKMHPTGLVWLIISNKINDHICSGKHHIYRGVLSGTGKELENLFITSVREMEKFGIHDSNGTKLEIEQFRKLIKELG
jgi:aspartokinase-like uncharacterized kinase